MLLASQVADGGGLNSFTWLSISSCDISIKVRLARGLNARALIRLAIICCSSGGTGEQVVKLDFRILPTQHATVKIKLLAFLVIKDGS